MSMFHINILECGPTIPNCGCSWRELFTNLHGVLVVKILGRQETSLSIKNPLTVLALEYNHKVRHPERGMA